MVDKKESGKSYSSKNIKVLEGLEGVRHRPAMYIGSTSKNGLHHLVYEVVDNSVDEAMAGYCDKIEVTLNKNGSVTVKDNGRGIPVEPHPIYKKPALEIAITKLHAGGKFDKGTYAVSGGLHGVGISVVSALSKHMIAKVRRNGKIYQQEYKIGKTLCNLKIVGKTDKDDTGTEITFFPDDTIFPTTEFDFNVLQTRFREIAFLNKGVRIILKEEKTGKKETFHYEGGLEEFVKWVNKTKDALHKPIYFTKTNNGVVVEVAVQYNSGYQENVLGFVNTINTVEGGTHVVGFKTALTRAINDYSNKNKMTKNGNLTGDDVREGLTAIISVKVPEPQFEGQTKTKLGNSEVKGIVDSVSMVSLSEFFEENPTIARRIVNKALDSQKARNAAKKAKDLVRRKSAFGGSGLPGKLADCSKKKSEETEIYIVEGDSAGGSAKQARNNQFQAILPLRGKPLNVEKASPIKVFSNEEISNLITAIGTGVGEQFDAQKLRYSKIIIMADADVDGAHIKTLLLTFFFRFMPELIKNGNIYIAVSPLYRVRKRGDHYVYSDEELKEIKKKLGENASVLRFKGLGEMDPEQLWDTTMNPKTRMLKKVTIEDVVQADEVFSKLMGDDVSARKQFIAERSAEAQIDI
ncbi:MAG: DNA topoisomerase (ATP-hydrolyzing) subunit B [Nanoarchaeota archaeon]|nr:DNA topoisomerase (ATP-hydrolyzing) subunit B [Nanoarchaeota archaeon]MBU1051926.1 DNA topoisomerase (ATP-hydrolyzing) subunit B [Nanoarchaeota archaeon]MBU1988140.1 DNA topoisomerase (ATP-hydrolyzing) subunit B [Nanoarchaeota archaeon]